MQAQIRRSSLLLAALLGVGLVAGLIAFSPALTQMYYVQLAVLVLGAGLLVTVYNRCMTARARRRAAAAAQAAPVPAAEDTAPHMDDAIAASEDAGAVAAVACGAQEEAPAYAATQAAQLPVPEDAGAAALLTEDDLPEDLDALLDIAYEASAQDPARAIRAYRAALARYPGDSYIPYLVIELSTLYKNVGDYAAARGLFAHALTLPAVTERDVMVQEFRRSIRDLDALDRILAAQGAPPPPFGEIPKALLDEANRQADAQTPTDVP